MSRCPITYELCKERYSKRGLNLLSRTLMDLKDFPYTPKEQIARALEIASKLSIQGVQPKLSALLNIKAEEFEIVEKKGRFILKPPHHLYEEVPQNEDVTMRLAAEVGIEVPLHGMIYNIDGSLTYFIKRFDRESRNKKVGVEDFSQLSQISRDKKYDSSMEKVVDIIEKYCTFPAIEKLKLFRLTLFNFLIGNEDMHLKNFSLIKQDNIELSPAYDLLNTTILMSKPKEEVALPIRGKKSNLKKADLIEYFGKERLAIPEDLLAKELLLFEQALPKWEELLEISFLSEKMRNNYRMLIQNRWKRLQA